MGGWTWRWACGLRPARGKSGGRVEGNESETEGRHSEDVVIERKEEVKVRKAVEDAYIRMRMSAQIEMSRLTSAFVPPPHGYPAVEHIFLRASTYQPSSHQNIYTPKL